ncbi:STAS domain-containing protein [Dactylosporangium sp. CA-139114]|uniref:STAS domain-containing protein n=1 Tax=Dactylosporangium sp. CA-139114 TaxID=3239931 RepID=UPI003D96F021
MRVDGGADVATVAVVGVLDLDTGNRLFDAIAAVLGRDGLRRVDVDLGAVTMLDAAGVGVLLAARNRARTAGVRLRVRNLSEPAREVLEIVGLLGIAA